MRRNRSRKERTLDQEDHIEDVLKKFNMEDCNPVKTPLDPNQSLTKNMAPKVEAEIEIKKTKYKTSCTKKHLVASCMPYLATRPDLGYAISTWGTFAENPGHTEIH